jgi:hypothetical protein
MRKDLIKKEIIKKIKEKEKEIEVSLESMISEVAEHTSLEYINIVKSLMENVITEDNVMEHIEIWGKTLGKNSFLGNEMRKELSEHPVNIAENLKALLIISCHICRKNGIILHICLKNILKRNTEFSPVRNPLEMTEPLPVRKVLLLP